MLYWLVHVETVEVMTAVSPLLEEFVCVSVFLFIFFYLFAPTGLMEEGMVTSTSV